MNKIFVSEIDDILLIDRYINLRIMILIRLLFRVKFLKF